MILRLKVVDPDENLYKEFLADLDAKYFFPENISFRDYFQNTNNIDFLAYI